MKEINEETKRRIADLYQNTKMSAGAIAAALGISRDTVHKYKNYWLAQKRL
jgi:response regulator of citrate/malate metabolism